MVLTLRDPRVEGKDLSYEVHPGRRPDNGATWSLRLQVQFMFPK